MKKYLFQKFYEERKIKCEVGKMKIPHAEYIDNKLVLYVVLNCCTKLKPLYTKKEIKLNESVRNRL